jgi:hypothetical protein
VTPRILFDKSVFQATPVSAFVTVDRYLEIVMPPILVREIGGDLAVASGKRKEKDQSVFVEKLAHRPGVRAFVAHHALLIQRDLLGCPIAMDGRVPSMMEPVQIPDGTRGLRSVESPEEYALNRWRRRDFTELDILWAERWQRVQKTIRSGFYTRTLQKSGIVIEQAETLEQLDQQIENLISNPQAQARLLNIIFTDFAVPDSRQVLTIKRFQSKKPRLLIGDFAPYAAFCLKANLLLGFAGGLLTRRHPHDLRDLEYCYYLPFCEVFASADNFHYQLAPLLLRSDQMLVGAALIDDLRRLTANWTSLTAKEKVEFARVNGDSPPQHDGSVLRAIWERYRGPNAPRIRPTNPPPDSFFRNLIKQSYGSEQILDDVDVEKVDVVVQRVQMTRARARELYPSFNFDE